MSDNKLSLKSLLVPSKEVEVDFPGFEGFKLKLSFLSRETLVNMRKKATKVTFKGRPIEELNEDLFLKLYVEACIKSWEGLTLEYVNQLAPVDLGDADLSDTLPFTQENALYLMKASSVFDQFITETVSELGNFTKSNKV